MSPIKSSTLPYPPQPPVHALVDVNNMCVSLCVVSSNSSEEALGEAASSLPSRCDRVAHYWSSYSKMPHLKQKTKPKDVECCDFHVCLRAHSLDMPAVPQLGGARAQHRDSASSPSSQGRPCTSQSTRWILFTTSIFIKFREGVATIIN